MIRLLGSELMRLSSRRLFRWVSALFAGCVVLIGVLVMMNGTFLRRDLEGALVGLAFPLVMLGWLVGASAIGAEWTHRTVTALLTWEPRRLRVLATKAVAATIFTFVLVVLLESVFTLVFLAGAQDDGSVFDWGAYLAIAGRILFVALVASVLGFGLATIGKNTGAALGGGMAYLLVVESLIRGFKPGWSGWLLGSNMGRVIEGDSGAGLLAERSTEAAGVVLLAYGAGLFLLALWFFRRREIG